MRIIGSLVLALSSIGCATWSRPGDSEPVCADRQLLSGAEVHAINVASRRFLGAPDEKRSEERITKLGQCLSELESYAIEVVATKTTFSVTFMPTARCAREGSFAGGGGTVTLDAETYEILDTRYSE